MLSHCSNLSDFVPAALCGPHRDWHDGLGDGEVDVDAEVRSKGQGRTRVKQSEEQKGRRK
jgi:hypothetical protein